MLSIVILAAGQGKRMYSALPKVLHPLAGTPLLEHVYDAAKELAGEAVYVVIGHGSSTVQERLGNLDVSWCEQREQLGTGHAVQQALPSIPDEHLVLVLYGDVPLTSSTTLAGLVEAARPSGFSLLTVNLTDPSGYGRIVRDQHGAIQRIVEQKDATAEELGIHEINTGIMVVGAEKLKRWLAQVDADNAQAEYYLTDIVAMAVGEGIEVVTQTAATIEEVTGVNDRVQLAELERYYQHQKALELMRRGVSFADPKRFDLRGELECGKDVVIDVNVIVEGRVSLGSNVSIGPNTFIRDCEIADDVTIFANSVLEEAVVGAGSRIGPFSRLRPETRLATEVHIGNFVEIKKSDVAHGSKINHLSYVGDTDVGSDVNIGAGTITCNYDGANKHRTVIGDGAFIGSDTQLVAPITVGAGATLGAGTTLSADAPAHKLTITRAPQKTIDGWTRPTKKSK